MGGGLSFWCSWYGSNGFIGDCCCYILVRLVGAKFDGRTKGCPIGCIVMDIDVLEIGIGFDIWFGGI